VRIGAGTSVGLPLLAVACVGVVPTDLGESRWCCAAAKAQRGDRVLHRPGPRWLRCDHLGNRPKGKPTAPEFPGDAGERVRILGLSPDVEEDDVAVSSV